MTRSLVSLTSRFSRLPFTLGLLGLAIALNACSSSQGGGSAGPAASDTQGSQSTPPSPEAPVTFLPVCNRTAGLQSVLVNFFGKPCQQITEQDLATITQLELNSLGIESLQEGDLTGMTQLEEVFINNNPLSRIPERIFFPTPHLTTIDLSVNQLTELPPRLLNGQSSLIFLMISMNPLTTLPESFFNGLTELRSIDLALNRLTAIPTAAFPAMTHLESVSAYGNSFPDAERNRLIAESSSYHYQLTIE